MSTIRIAFVRPCQCKAPESGPEVKVSQLRSRNASKIKIDVGAPRCQHCGQTWAVANEDYLGEGTVESEVPPEDRLAIAARCWRAADRIQSD